MLCTMHNVYVYVKEKHNLTEWIHVYIIYTLLQKSDQEALSKHGGQIGDLLVTSPFMHTTGQLRSVIETHIELHDCFNRSESLSDQTSSQSNLMHFRLFPNL